MPESKAAPKKSRADTGGEKVIEIPLAELHPFKNHPFKVKDDDAMMETADSIRQYGVLVPAIARPSPEGGYEIIAGHRRHRASELAEKETMPVIVRSLDDDAATIIMVDSNLQREGLLPSDIIDTQVIKSGSVLRTAVIFFYLSNEGISILENVALIGLPVPQKLKDVLEQLREEKNSEKGE